MLRSETTGDPTRMARALDGLRKYQEAERRPPPAPPEAVAEVLGAKLRDYGGSGLATMFVPSLINPPSILDLSAENSLLRWLAARGRVRPLLVDWGWDVERRRNLDVAGHVEMVLLPLLEALGERTALVGYCLGGTMALGAAAARTVAGVATIAAPWRFSGFPNEARAMLAQLWAGAQATSERLGVLPMEALQSAFWSLDPGRTVAKFEAFAAMPADSDKARAFVTLEDWANDGPPVPHAAARELFEGLFAQDASGGGGWLVADPAALPCPVLEVVSTIDRIVPAATAAGAGERIELALGHVGMVVGSRAKAALWEPLEGWLSRLGSSC
ncbi:MAG TPA: alpha/beta fold hydrolase [Allosphingosinicella sp.]|jgi:polyhydroxyalkanoate synthase